MKSLLAELRPPLVHQAAFSFFINLLYLVPAIFTLQVFDRVIPSNSIETLVLLLVGVGITLAILLVLDYARLRLQHATGNLIDERLSPPVIHTIVQATALAPQALRADAIRDVGLLRNLFSANGVTAVFDAPWVIVYVGVIWLFHPVLGLGAALCAAVMLLLAWLNDRFTRTTLDTLQAQGLRASRYVEGSLRNAEVLQAMGMTERLLGRWHQQQDVVLDLQTRVTRTSVAFTALTKFVRQLIQVGMMALGAYLVLTQRASAGVMIATTILLGRAVQPVEQLVGSWRTLSDARAAYLRLLAFSTYFDASAVRVALPRPVGRVVVDALSFRPPGADKLLLTGVSLQLEPGEALAIIGPSAAGKSTLARLLTGIWQPSAGKVRLDGVDVSDWPRAEIGPWIGYVPQDVELFDGTVADNIGRLNDLDSEAVIKAAKRANAHELIVQLPQGYDTPVGDQGLRLSPGQRQRIALARAMYGDIRLLILDEPNSSLDSDGEMALARALSSIRGEGVTSVVVTHRPSLIAHVDKILILEAGRVSRFGPAGDVMKAMQKLAQATLAAQAA
jgi:PrtD family type I secretion system ABC transporter